MQVIHARSLTHHVKSWLTASEHVRVLHVFEDACNLINEHGEILSVVTQKIGDGPFNLVPDKDVLFSDHLNVDSKITIRSNQLNLEHLKINIDNAEFWSPLPHWEILHGKRNNIPKQIISLSNWNSFIKQEIAHRHCIRSAVHVSSQSTLLAMTRYTQSLLSAIVNADLPKSIDSAKQLAGLGQGLTPSGDDFILGAVLAAWIIHPRNTVEVLAGEITDMAAQRTTSLSAAWLRSAGRGEAGILWHNFFNALIADDTAEIQWSIAQLLSVGHTSGADAFAGFMSILIRAEEKSCPS